MFKRQVRFLLLSFMLMALVAGPDAGFARVGTPTALLRVSGGIHEALATDCTLYAAAYGADTQAGTIAQPISFFGAAQTATAGAVVCLLGGRYELPCTVYIQNSGTPSAWITFKNFGDGDVLMVWKGGLTCGDFPMIKLDSTRAGAQATSYVQFIGLTLDGQGTALDGFACVSNHDLRFSGNVIVNTGGAGIATVGCNYVVADHNILNHNGYLPPGAPQGFSATSGISFHNNACSDGYTGFHFVAANNIVVGEVDQTDGTDRSQVADGNGIIIDANLSCSSGAVSPASLVVNNLIYGNGGRCIEANQVANAWLVNNTCYINNLDPNVAAGTAGSISSQNSSNTYFVNNISVSWQPTNPPYELLNASTSANFFTNLSWGGPCFFDATSTPPGGGTGTDFCAFPNSGFLVADPQFVNPPHFDGQTPGQYRTARPPSAGTAFSAIASSCTFQTACVVSSAFAIGANASAIGVVGTDPTTLVPQNSAIWCDLGNWVYTDINGNPRGGGKWDLGAFQH
jgi:hypothetical protein